MASTAKVLEGQTLFDWCLVNTGAVSSMFDVMKLNGLNTIEVVPGIVLQIPPVLKQNVVDFFASKQIATGIISEITGGFSNTTVTIELLNSLDSIISTQAFSIGSGTQQILAPDCVVTLNGSAFQSVPAGINLSIDLRDGTGATLEPTSVSGSIITVATEEFHYQSAKLTKSGQDTPYASGDDGYYHGGRDLSFFDLSYPNIFGNYNRFTDVVGGSTYANDIVLDHSTFDGYSMLGYYRLFLADNVWATQLSNINSSTTGGYMGWRMTNIKEQANILYYNSTNVLSYPPFSLPGAAGIQTSTTTPQNTANIFATGAGGLTNGGFGSLPKTSPRPAIMCRDFTIDELI